MYKDFYLKIFLYFYRKELLSLINNSIDWHASRLNEKELRCLIKKDDFFKKRRFSENFEYAADKETHFAEFSLPRTYKESEIRQMKILRGAEFFFLFCKTDKQIFSQRIDRRKTLDLMMDIPRSSLWTNVTATVR